VLETLKLIPGAAPGGVRRVTSPACSPITSPDAAQQTARAWGAYVVSAMAGGNGVPTMRPVQHPVLVERKTP
jgi:hypothetical protein